jgi:hypothetical protein
LDPSVLLQNFLLNDIFAYLPRGYELSCYTNFEVASQSAAGESLIHKYRAHPSYQQKPWFDYVQIRWQTTPSTGGVSFQDLPARLHTFIDLREENDILFLNQAHSNKKDALIPDIYAIVESYERVYPSNTPPGETPTDESDTIIGCYHRTETKRMVPTLYLVQTACIRGPMFGMPDIVPKHVATAIACPRKYFFFLKPRSEWANCWEERLRYWGGPSTEESDEEEDVLRRQRDDLVAGMVPNHKKVMTTTN